ncbi:hypothetical protein Y032_0074g820 [Ancylostoma ceylanicum]|uniref:Uncharacterized protein n=1 Tax=Ancylostoma ceylanicum TaxID=53326 RepID=A0A016TV88_9BILA|nr:hypothetical protein Y032_0074g820 [Ancylostoma ceylanicum]
MLQYNDVSLLRVCIRGEGWDQIEAKHRDAKIALLSGFLRLSWSKMIRQWWTSLVLRVGYKWKGSACLIPRR